MGTRSAAETIAGIFTAFFEQSTWSQAELARRLGIGTRALRLRLDELLQTKQMPLVRDQEPPHVYWSVPQGWVPGGVVLRGDEAAEMLALLARLPRSQQRDRLLRRFTAAVGSELSLNAAPLRSDEQVLQVILDAAGRRIPLRFDYFSSSRGDHRVRIASVHHCIGGDRWRFVATCHDRQQLCWFRADSVLSAHLAVEVAFRAVEEATLATYLATSMDGFASDAPATCCSFNVRYPHARWVRMNLPEQEVFVTRESAAGACFTTETTAIDLLARFVVGLGDAVTSCSPELEQRVGAIARAALARAAEGRASDESS